MSDEIRFLTVLMLALVLLAAPASAGKVGSKYDGAADFSKYETFRWVDNPKPRGPRVSPGADIDLLIRGIVVAHLRSKGLEEVEGEADLLVNYDAVAVEALNVESMHQEITPGVAWVMDGDMRSFLEGNLAITITDAGTEKPVWSAWAAEKIKNPAYPEKQVNKLVKKLMARFPPKK